MGWHHIGLLHCVCVWHTMYALCWGHLLVFLAFFLLCDDGKKDYHIYFITTEFAFGSLHYPINMPLGNGIWHGYGVFYLLGEVCNVYVWGW